MKDSEGRTPLQIACIGKNKNGLKILSKLIELEKKKDSFKESIQKCYRVTSTWGNKEIYNLLKQTGIPDLSELSKFEGNNILAIAKDNGMENILYEDFKKSIRWGEDEKLEAFKKTDIYEVFMKRYEEEQKK